MPKRHRHPYGHSKPWYMRTDKAPTGRERIIARQLIAGSSMRDACRVAQYSPETVRAKAHEICKRPGVRTAIIELAQALVPQLPAVGHFSQQQMQASFSAELINPDIRFDELVAMIRGATKFIIDAASLRPSPKPHNKRPELTPEQKASLDQRVAELQRSAAQVSPREAGDTKPIEVSITAPEQAKQSATTVTPLPPAFVGADKSDKELAELAAIAEIQERDRYQHELKERLKRGDTQWWKRRQ
jgi:hypothetical protein